jgi:hypothetical protein
MSTNEHESEIECHVLSCVRSHRACMIFTVVMAMFLIFILVVELFSVVYFGSSLTTHRLRLKVNNIL